MTFPDFLESRAGTTLAYTFMGAVVGAVGWPFFLLYDLRYFHMDILENMTAHLFWSMELEAATLCAGVGFVRGARFGPLPGALFGLALGLLLSTMAAPLGLYAFLFPAGVPSVVVALVVLAGTLVGWIEGMFRAEEDWTAKEYSLEQIRKKSQRR